MNNVQEGVVLKTEGKFVRIKVSIHSSCDDCGACKSPEFEILAHNDINAKPGQKVLFLMDQNNMLKVSFILFFFPVVSIFIGAYLGSLLQPIVHLAKNLLMVLGGGFLFTLSVLNVLFQDRAYNFKPGNFAQVVEIIS